MDYLTESERLKLNHKGLTETGSADQISAAHPIFVSDRESPNYRPKEYLHRL